MSESVIASLVFAAVIAYPAVRICQRAGIYRAFALVLFIPLIGPLIFVLLIAFSTWPHDPTTRP